MKFRQGAVLIGVIAIVLASVIHSFAVEGLQLSVQCSNVVLTWPSVDGNGDAYIVRRRPDLTTNSSWTCLTNSYFAATGTNVTTYIDYGVVTNAHCDGESGSDSFASGSGLTSFANGNHAGNLFGNLNISSNYPPLPPGLEPGSSATSIHSFTHANDADDGPPSPFDAGSGSDTNATMTVDAEFYQVVKVGVHLYGITNGMVLSGVVPLNVEFGNVDTNRTLTGFYLTDTDPDGTNGTINGALFPYLPDQTNGYFQGNWDTTQVTNGTYSIILGTMLDDGTVYEDYPVAVTVSNLAWFPDSYNVNGEVLYLGVQTPYTDGTGTWQVDAYDDQGTHIGYFPGIIDTNGYLSYSNNPNLGFSIRNTDNNGNQLPSTSYTLVYQGDAAHPLASKPPYNMTNHLLVEYPWNFSPTLATICYMDVFGNTRPIAQTEALDMMQVVASIESVYHPLEIGDTYNVFQVGLNGDWGDVLINGIGAPNSRDFVYFGHGNLNVLGSGSTSLKASDVAFYLNNTNLIGGNPLNGVTYHPYRLVFLDGCDTAEGVWPTAFGIPKKTGMKITDFTEKRGIRPRAFMGWNRKKSIGWVYEGVMNPDHATYITTFWQKWNSIDPSTGNPFTIKAAIQAAGIETDSSTFGTYPNPQKRGMVLYGAEDLTIAK